MRMSDRINSINESGTLKFTSLIHELRKKGREIIDLAVGEPDLKIPEEIIRATKSALDNDKTKYSVVSGIKELKEAICENFAKNNMKYSPENILISNGSKQILYLVFQTICNPGDEIIIPRPYWVSFAEQVKLAGATPVFVDCVEDQLNIEDIKKSINGKTKAILINSPNNPTGAVYKRTDIIEISKIALAKDLFVISDEAYASLVYDNLKNTSIASLNEEIKKKTFTVKTFSKEFSMTGFRVGYVACEKELIAAMNKLQGHISGNTCTFAQYGAAAALDIDKKELEERRKIFEKKRDLAYDLTTEIFACKKPNGAFYLFPNVKKVLNEKIKTSEELAEFLLEAAGVAVIPGKEFGVKNHIRISYATSEENIKKAFEKIREVI